MGSDPTVRASWKLFALSLSASLGLGCVSVSEQLAARRFDEACLATRASEQRGATAETISRMTDATISIRALGPVEIAKEFASNPLDEHSLLLEVTTAAHVAPNQIDIQVLFVRSDRLYAGRQIWSESQLAELLHLGTLSTEYDGRGLLDRVWTSTPRPAYRTAFTCAGGADCADRIAFATAVGAHNKQEYERCDQGRNQPCRRHLLLNDYPPNTKGGAMLRLLVRHSLKTCWTEHLLDLPLPDGGTTGERINRLFAAGPLPLRDLHGHEPLGDDWLGRCSSIPEAKDCEPPRLR